VQSYPFGKHRRSEFELARPSSARLLRLRLSASSIIITSGRQFLPGMSNAALGEVALKQLHHAFQDPVPSYCAVKIIVLLNRLTNSSRANVSAGDLKRKDEAFTSASRWFTLRRSREQIQAVMTIRCACSRKETMEDLHVSGAGVLEYDASSRGRPPGEVLLHSCIGELRHAQERHPGESIKLHRFSERQARPFTTYQIFPHGEDTICGYLDWMASEDVVTCQQVTEVFTSHFGYA